MGERNERSRSNVASGSARRRIPPAIRMSLLGIGRETVMGSEETRDCAS